MKTAIVSFVRRALGDQRGQVLRWVALGFVGMLGMGGLTVDVGNAYVVHAHGINANAAVLAAAGLVYNTSTTDNASTEANTYSASPGDKNVNSNLTVVTTVRTLWLLAAACRGRVPIEESSTECCQGCREDDDEYDFHESSWCQDVDVAATAIASMQGQSQPWNVAIIIDATGSMSTTDSNCGTNVTEFQCAMNGVAAMLGSTNPCKSGATSGTNAAANFHGSLWSFPGVDTSTVADENACSSYTTPAFEIYSLPVTTATS